MSRMLKEEPEVPPGTAETFPMTEEERNSIQAIAEKRVKVMPALRWQVFQSDDWKCVSCGRKAADDILLHIDHIVPRSKGGRDEIDHGNIAGNFLALLKLHLRGSGCKTLNSDCRVSIVGAAKYVYPDISVTCEDRDQTTTEYITYPCLIVEVLSPTTEAYDRGKKFKMYRRNPCLQEYVLVSVDAMEIELFRKTEMGDWRIINYQKDDAIELKSVNFSCQIQEIYEGIVFIEGR